MAGTDPIWTVLKDEGRYNLVWLAERTGYSHSHVKAIAVGREAASPRFRAACAALLERPERELFDQGGASSASAHEGPSRRAGPAVAAGYTTPAGLSIPEEAPRTRSA